jgi:CubicO group peptidase (beta-lactamase class C family)
MSRPSFSPFKRFAKPAAVVLVAGFVLVNALTPASGSASRRAPASPAELDAWFDARMRDAGIPGAAMVVVRDGHVIETHTYGVADDGGRPIKPSTPFVIGSLTKSITALAVMQLAESGRLSLDTPVSDLLPQDHIAGQSNATKITVRHLLNQTSGLSTAAGLRPFSTAVTSLDARVRDFEATTLVSPPGTAFHYSNANYLVLGRIVEVVSGQSFGEYVRTHVFEPLDMTQATTDAGEATGRGLTMAHRLWFGQAPSSKPLFRADMVPAGFVAASVDDMGRFLLAQLGDLPAGVSPASLDAMHAGVAPTGLPDQRYGFGWFDGSLGNARIVSHTGSTTDMASIAVLVPSEHLGVTILMNGTSTLYETLHKPDTIGLAATALLLGQNPPGTLELFYPGFVALSLFVMAVLLRGLARLVRAQRTRPIASRPEPSLTSADRGWRILRIGYRAYLDVVVPIAILLFVPGYFATDWSVMVRIDLGQVLLAIAALRVLDGLLRMRGWHLGRANAAFVASPAGAGQLPPDRSAFSRTA